MAAARARPAGPVDRTAAARPGDGDPRLRRAAPSTSAMHADDGRDLRDERRAARPRRRRDRDRPRVEAWNRGLRRGAELGEPREDDVPPRARSRRDRRELRAPRTGPGGSVIPRRCLRRAADGRTSRTRRDAPTSPSFSISRAASRPSVRQRSLSSRWLGRTFCVAASITALMSGMLRLEVVDHLCRRSCAGGCPASRRGRTAGSGTPSPSRRRRCPPRRSTRAGG